MLEFLNHEIQKTKDLYTKDYHRMVSYYNQEKATIKDYNGRQLLELIQNADDSGSSKVIIKIDPNKNILSISNLGEPFSKEGYQSLMIPNLSSKRKTSFIGNKGLGFRSIINWSDQIKIIDKETTVTFSKEIARAQFKKLFSANKRQVILNEFELDEHTVPLPFLAIPKISKSSKKVSLTTTIEIKYKEEFYDDIIEQVEELQPEILLFLNHISEIKLKGFEGVEGFKSNRMSINSSSSGFVETITIEDDEWNIFENKGLLDEEYQDEDKKEKEYYQVKIALQEDLSNDVNRLFSFFPTKVDITFPFIIHGTFDLDSSRNQLVKSDKNKFVLKKLVELIVDTAKHLSKNKVSWLPIEFLNYDEPNTVLADLEFYETINEEIKELALFPCIDNQYRRIEDIIYYDEQLSSFFEKAKIKDGFHHLIKGISAELKEWLEDKVGLVFDTLEDKDFVDKIETISKHPTALSLSRRAELIYIISQVDEDYGINKKYSLLLNDKKEVIDKTIAVFTPVKGKVSKSYDLPSFVKIDFLNKTLYKHLLSKFNLEAYTDRDRQLQRKIKDIVAIQSFEPATVIEKVISQCNKAIKGTRTKNVFVKESVKALFQIFQQLGEGTRPDTSGFLLINKSGNLSKAADLFLSAGYSSGVLTELLFKDVFERNRFLVSPKKFGLEQEDTDLVENFFVDFLKVNRYTKIISNGSISSGYISYVFKKIEQPYNYRSSSCQVSQIDLLEIILKKISREKLILWFLVSTFLKRQLNDENNTDVFKYSREREHWGNYSHQISKKPSYVKYQIQKENIFSEYVVETSRIGFLNPFDFQFNSSFFSNYGIEEEKIKKTLILLGAKRNFSELGAGRVAEIIEMLPEKDPVGIHAQRIYKLAYDNFQKKGIPLREDGLKLFAVKNGEKGYFPVEEIYYYDNLKLPKSIVEKKAILQFPKRRGERQVANFFGIRTFKNFEFEIVRKIESKAITDDLNEHLLKIKPYILALRLDNISTDRKDLIAPQVNITKSIKIKICSQLVCDINGSQIELDNYDFINEGHEFNIKLAHVNNVSSLKKDSKFCDVISEILSIAFTVNNSKNEFRSIFRNDLSDTEHLLVQDLGEIALEDAKSYLGMSNNEQGFWKIIYTLKNRAAKVLDKLTIAEIAERVDKDFDVELSQAISNLDYKHLHSRDNFKYLKTIFQQLYITVADFNQNSFQQLNFEETHRQAFNSCINSLQQDFKTLLWHTYNQNKEMQNDFLSVLNSYKANEFFGINIKNYYTQFEVAYEELVISKIKDKYQLDLSKRLPKKVDFSKIFNKNLQEIGLPKEDLDEKIRSLLCFEGTIKLVQQLIKKEASPKEEETIPITMVGNLIDVNSIPIPVQNSKILPKKLSAYNPNTQKRKNRAGKNAEELVYDTLVNKYGEDNVDWVSGNSKTKVDGVDGLGYDLTYKENGVLKYVEVKSFSGNTFFLTKNEKEFALAHAKDYEVFLVRPDGDILMHKSIFVFNDLETFEQNSKFSVGVKDYIISLNILS